VSKNFKFSLSECYLLSYEAGSSLSISGSDPSCLAFTDSVVVRDLSWWTRRKPDPRGLVALQLLLPVITLDWSDTASGKSLAVPNWPEWGLAQTAVPLRRQQWFVGRSNKAHSADSSHGRDCAGREGINHRDNKVKPFAALVYVKPEVFFQVLLAANTQL